MPKDYRIILYLIFGVAVVVCGVFLFPPITPRGSEGSASLDQAKFEAAVSQELAYCREQSDGINCRCFASLSGTILAHDAPRAPRAVYADKRQLARGQAGHSC